MKTFTLYGSEEVKKVIREFFKSNHEEIVNLQDQKELNTSSTPKQTVNTVVRRIKSVFFDTDRYTNTSYRNENYHNMAGKVLRVAVLKVSRIDLSVYDQQNVSVYSYLQYCIWIQLWM